MRNAKAMKVVILCGGLGTRLREETEFRPKSMVPIGERPILWHIMKICAHRGFTQFVLYLGYKGESMLIRLVPNASFSPLQFGAVATDLGINRISTGESIKDFFRNDQWNTSDVTLQLGARPRIKYHNQHGEEEWTVTLVDTGQNTQTGGRLKWVLPHIDSDTFLLTYGDGVTDSNIRESVRIHQRHRPVLTLTAVSPLSNPRAGSAIWCWKATRLRASRRSRRAGGTISTAASLWWINASGSI